MCSISKCLLLSPLIKIFRPLSHGKSILAAKQIPILKNTVYAATESKLSGKLRHNWIGPFSEKLKFDKQIVQILRFLIGAFGVM
jgi:hypothetical protein